MPATKKHPSSIHNVPSFLLTEEENNKLFTIIGRRCLSQATAVVQVFLAEPPNYDQWLKKCCGVACFVKDSSRRSYFIRVYDLKKGVPIWEQELYIQFKYYTPLPFFHTFDADFCPAALNFADQREATKFQQAIENKLRQRQIKQTVDHGLERSVSINHTSSSQIGMTNNIIPHISTNVNRSSSVATLKGKVKKKEAKKVNRLRKTDIGQPTNFQHIQHVGWDPNKGLETDNLDPVLKDFFKKAGVTEKDLQDQETANFIYDFIDHHGGVEAIRRADPNQDCSLTHNMSFMSNQMETSSPIQAPSAPPIARVGVKKQQPLVPPPPQERSLGMAATAPPVPSRATLQRHITVPGNAVQMPPPPPPPSTTPTVKKPSGLPPPPRSAPPSGESSTPSVVTPAAPPPDRGRQQLLDQIAAGNAHLKPVAQRQSTSGGSGDNRSTLLDQIRQGTHLKHVAPSASTASQNSKKAPILSTSSLTSFERKDATADKSFSPLTNNLAKSQPPLDGVAGALARALQERAKAIQSTSDSSENEDFEEEDEWEDE